MKRVFLIHGWDGKPNNHWFPWLRKTLETDGFSVFSLAMPSSAHPKLNEWLDEMKKSIVSPDEEVYFVGHSLGCITIARYLVSLPADVHVGGCVFVAGFSNSLDVPEIAEFFAMPIDFESVKRHCDKFVTIYSDNDEYISFDESKDFSKMLGAREVFEPGKGHFSSESKGGTLPSALEAVLSVAVKK